MTINHAIALTTLQTICQIASFTISLLHIIIYQLNYTFCQQKMTIKTQTINATIKQLHSIVFLLILTQIYDKKKYGFTKLSTHNKQETHSVF